jgi:hypothetical protein
MPSDTKSLIDDIIHNTDNSYPAGKGPVYDKDTVGAEITQNNYPVQTFDKGKFREKLSLYVLKDLISAMMADDVADVDGMVDASIMRHIKDDYNGSCYSYLCDARDRTKSPLLSDIIQEVDDATDDKEKELEETKDDDNLAGEINIAVMLKDVTNYEDFRKKLKEAVSKKVIDDVYGVVTKKNDAPVFEDLDEELQAKDADDVAAEKEEDITEESVILRLTGAIVTEYAMNKTPITTEEGSDRAVIEFCLHQLDMCTKNKPKVSMWQRHKM